MLQKTINNLAAKSRKVDYGQKVSLNFTVGKLKKVKLFKDGRK